MRKMKKYYRREAKQNIFTLLHHNYSAILSQFRKFFQKINQAARIQPLLLPEFFKKSFKNIGKKLQKDKHNKERTKHEKVKDKKLI